MKQQGFRQLEFHNNTTYICDGNWHLNRYEAYSSHTNMKYGYSDMEDPSPLVYLARMINDDKRTSRFTLYVKKRHLGLIALY